MKKEIIAMLLAGGVGSRLGILAKKRAKPAIPFGGIYRIIDFTMSNIANSDIDVVGVLTQYKPLSLMEHIDNGRPWDLFGRTRLVEILPPKTGEEISDWYKGTSDAVYQNLGFIEDFSPELVLIVSGDHIYYMNYKELIFYHKNKNADATICLIKVPFEQAGNFGIACVNQDDKIIDWEEKPKMPRSNLASMGIYLFNKEVLKEMLIDSAKRGGVDFARDIIPLMLGKKRVFGYEFSGYWRDVGTIDAYWSANMDLLNPESGLNIEKWGIKTNLSVKGEIGDWPPIYIGRNAEVKNSLISQGCEIEGTVVNSVLSPGVKVEKRALVRDSVIFHGTIIRRDSVIERAIIDKDVEIGEKVLIRKQKTGADLTTGITVIGKGTKIPSQAVANKSLNKNLFIL
uniref:Glucose-1-phosphate adenylyltransferase n=1 Tax=candidate division WOR-3 bacterium TaxID=2052148 RepID=A0A7C4TCZ0_UNCW3